MNHEILQNRKRSAMSGWWRFMTLAVACGLLVIALWNGVRVLGGNRTRDLSSKTQQSAPTKFHTERDSLSRKERVSKDPVSAFVERAKRGMTEQEIRGMIADYEAIGPMPTSGDIGQSRDYEQKQNDWFLEALDEGLSFTYEQKQVARAVLFEKLNLRLEKPREILPSETNNQARIIFFPLWIDQPLYNRETELLPWNILDLTEAQTKLTYKQSLQLGGETANKKFIVLNGNISCHTDQTLTMQNSEWSEPIEYPPSSDLNLASSVNGAIKGGIIDISNTFPLTPDQKLESHRGDILAQAKLLHPAQLRMALLLNHGVAQTLKFELDKPE